MTTEVSVQPAGHKIEVTKTEGDTSTVTILEPNTSRSTFWIYGDVAVTIREIKE